MEKKSLLVVAAMLIALSAAAQFKGVDGVAPSQPLSLSRVQPQVKEVDVQLRAPGEALPSPHQSPAFIKPYYLRPAGAFYSPFIAVSGVGWYSFGVDIMQLKPYSDYTYYTVADGADDNDEPIWENSSGGEFNTYYTQHLTVNYGIEITETPVYYLYHSDMDVDECFQYPYYMMTDGYVVDGRKPALVYSAPDASYLSDYEKDCELLLSSKTMCQGGRNGDATGIIVTYNDAVPFDNNTYGRWFGKNGGHYDGMAQAFEKPTHPYVLKKVCMQTGYLECEAPVQLCCTVYRMDEIPAYRDDGPVELSGNFGEPIAIGYTLVTPDTQEETAGLLTFTLYGREDGLDYEITPTIVFPILLVIDDYNNPECNALRDFSCFVGNDIHVDEGYGELAYLKCPVNDEEGHFTGRYVWKGLNNLFSMGELKSGYTIFIVADMPYLAFNRDDESGEYTFGEAGGEMQRLVGDETVTGIEFKSYEPIIDGDWQVHGISQEELPEWLEISLVDGVEDGNYNGIVTAHVVAEPLPEGLDNREATVRFEFPGAHVDYTFKQEKGAGHAELFDSKDAVAVGCYDILGHQLQGIQQGLNIVKMSDGTTRKILK